MNTHDISQTMRGLANLRLGSRLLVQALVHRAATILDTFNTQVGNFLHIGFGSIKAVTKPEVLEPELCSIAMYCTCCLRCVIRRQFLGSIHAAGACQREVAAALCRELPCDGVNEAT